MNETKLRQALGEISDDVGTLDLVTPALHRARRARTVRLLVTPALVLLAAVILVVAVRPLVAPIVPATTTPSPTAFGIPDRLEVPWWSNSVTDDPPGRASVVFGGQGLEFTSLIERSRVATVGPTGYRATGHWWDADEIHLGEVVHLSPDGTKLAWAEESLRIVDLGTGKSKYLPLPYPGIYGTLGQTLPHKTEVLAWSPDGQSLAIAETFENTYSQPPIFGWSGLGIIDLQTGDYRQLTTVDGKINIGWAAAFSPDGQRIAYQSGDRLSVIDINGQPVSATDLKPGEHLAGKGAWTPDGSSIAVAVPQRCCFLATNWTIRYLAPNTGQATTGPQFNTIANTTAIRLLGWASPTRAVIVAFPPDPDGPTGSVPPDDRTHYFHVERVDLLALEPGKPADTILRSPNRILTIDVAEQAIASGAIVPAPPRPGPSPRLIRTIAVINVVAYATITSISFIVLFAVRRRDRRSAWRQPPTSLINAS